MFDNQNSWSILSKTGSGCFTEFSFLRTMLMDIVETDCTREYIYIPQIVTEFQSEGQES